MRPAPAALRAGAFLVTVFLTGALFLTGAAFLRVAFFAGAALAGAFLPNRALTWREAIAAIVCGNGQGGLGR